MKDQFKIAIIGGTGKSGKYLVKEMFSRGFRIRLLLRDPERLSIKNSFMEIVKGDARNFNSVSSLIEGCQAVVSTLGQPRGEVPIFSEATANVIRAMTQHNVDRYILTTGLNVDCPSDKKGLKTKMATDWMKSNYPDTTRDKQTEMEILAKSEVSWTLVRLPLIVQTEEKGEVLTSLEDCPGETISSTDLACFLIDQLSDDSYIRKAPFIANA